LVKHLTIARLKQRVGDDIKIDVSLTRCGFIFGFYKKAGHFLFRRGNESNSCVMWLVTSWISVLISSIISFNFAMFKRERYNRLCTCEQVLASTAKNMLLLDLGMTISFPTIVIPRLRNTDDPLALNDEQASWFGKSLFCGSEVQHCVTAQHSRA